MAIPARTIDHTEIAALRARVRERRLVEPDDYLVIDDLLGLTIFLDCGGVAAWSRPAPGLRLPRRSARRLRERASFW